MEWVHDRRHPEQGYRSCLGILRLAKLKQAACLEDLDLHTPRQLDRALVLKLADCQWAADHLNILITDVTQSSLEDGNLWSAPVMAYT